MGWLCGALPEAAEQLRAHLIALVHHPLALESGLSSGDAAALRVSEAEALACARRVIVTSPSTARLVVSDYGVAAERVTIVRPGNDRVAPAGAKAEGPIELLAIGAVVPRKGYEVLLAAVATLLDLQWRLTIVGELGRDADATVRLHARTSRVSISPTAFSSRARSRQTVSRRSTPVPTFSCSPRGSRVMAWRSPRRSRVAFP